MIKALSGISNNRVALAAIVFGAFFSVGLLWAWITQPTAAVAPINSRFITDAKRPGAEIIEISTRLREHLDTPSAAQIAAAEAAAAANVDDPESAALDFDVVGSLRADITAVIHREGENGEAIWIIDREQARPGARKRLVPGDAYMHDWLLVSIKEQEVIVAKGDATETIQLYSLPDS